MVSTFTVTKLPLSLEPKGHSGEVIRASAPYTSGWGSFVLLKMDSVMVVWAGSLSMLHGSEKLEFPALPAQ